MPSDPCASNVDAGQSSSVEPVDRIHDSGQAFAMYSVKPAVDDEPFTRCTTLIASDGRLTSGLSDTISASSHVVICALKIFASTHDVRCTDAPPTGAEWNTPIPPIANGTCTIVRPDAFTAAYRSAVIGMSPAPKWFSA